jgi:hypothetical protein
MAYEHQIYVITDAIVALLTTASGDLGINYVGSYDEKRLPHYPAVVVSPGTRTKTIHGVQVYEIGFLVDLWVYHGDLTESHAARSKLDLQLVASIEQVLETDYTLGGKVVHGFIANEVPGIIQPRADKSDMIVGTRMQWMGMSRRGFTY